MPFDQNSANNLEKKLKEDLEKKKHPLKKR